MGVYDEAKKAVNQLNKQVEDAEWLKRAEEAKEEGYANESEVAELFEKLERLPLA